ncbi:protein Jade-1-like protein [Dinothrombium tinctorium]|uniref:Protein Jade-1-like protein n=1 Tax=Dinothrombium tinctorium TaxID=1965070 RepID=A0A3S3PTN6_9ACAR|nr:protein Jade-1-like protein [Dinothrombium tinctorium]
MLKMACYGIVSIPDGEWLCGPCKEYGSQTNVSCVLCPNTGGAFKPTTTTGQWAHVSCALWVPEVSIGCVSSMEPITKVKQIPASRWNLICSICNIKKGAPIQCTVKSCKASYHVTCAFNNKLKMKAVVDGDSNGVKLKSYCPKHSETEENIEKSQKQKGSNELNKNQREIEIATAIQTNDSNETDNNEFYKYVDISQIYHKFFPILQTKYPDSSQQTYQFYVDLILQYWKLKRVSNDGAPLIKITTTSSIEELQMKQRSEIMRLRVDLERIRNLSYMLCKREKLKRNWCRTHQSTVESALSYATGVTLTSTPNDLRQSHVNEEKLKLVKDIIDSSVIYDEKECDKHKPSLIVRRLKDLVKKDKLKRHRPNPYAKFYIPHGRRRSTEEEQNVNKPHVNGSYHKQPSLHNVNGLSKSQNLPLNNKTVPTNGLSRSISNGLGVNENSFKNVDKNKQTNRISMNSKCRIKVDDKNTTSPVLTRSSSLVGYKIPKKKREDSDNSPSKVNESKLRNELLSDIKLKSQPGNHVFANERRSAFGRYCSSALNASWKIVAGHDKLQKEFHLKLRNANNHQCSANTRTESGDEVAMIASAANDVDMRRENVLR